MIERNPAYRGAMKTYTSMPTSHPFWIDDKDYFRGFRKFFHKGISFQKAFVIVICLHLAGVVALHGFSQLRGALRARPMVDKPAMFASSSSNREHWPNADQQPRVVTVPKPRIPESAERFVETKVPVEPQQTRPVKTNPTIASNPGKSWKQGVEDWMAELAVAAQDAGQFVNTIASQTALIADQFQAGLRESEQKAEMMIVNMREGAGREVTKVASELQVTTEKKVVELSGKLAETLPVKPRVRAQTVIPQPKREVASNASAVNKNHQPSAKSARHYTLAAGDNLYMVSRKLGVSYNDLTKANGIRDPRSLRVGQTLVVPTIASL
jgi:LysM repeat protein